jgi:DNA repair protein RecO (recombination protein O)
MQDHGERLTVINRVLGIVLTSIDYGETNKIINILTPNAGKVGIMVRGAKKLRSRYGALVQPFTEGEFLFFRGGTGSGLGTLQSGEITAPHQMLREELDLMACSAYMVEMTNRMLTDGEPAEPIFYELQAALNALEAGKNPVVVADLYEMKMLQFSGYGPQFTTCVSCGRQISAVDISEAIMLDAAAGGVRCPRCIPAWARSTVQTSVRAHTERHAPARVARPSAEEASEASQASAQANLPTEAANPPAQAVSTPSVRKQVDYNAPLMLSRKTVAVLKLLTEMSLTQLGNISLHPTTQQQLKDAMYYLLMEHTNLKLKSRDFFDMIVE